MLPYGNAKTLNGVVSCQHGEAECKFNMVEACGIKHLPDKYMPFIFCVEGANPNKVADMSVIIKSCTNNTTVATNIANCYGGGSGSEGKAAIAEAAAQTALLNHAYTPWVVINGQHAGGNEANFKQAICKAYTGTDRPTSCDEDSHYKIERWLTLTM